MLRGICSPERKRHPKIANSKRESGARNPDTEEPAWQVHAWQPLHASLAKRITIIGAA